MIQLIAETPRDQEMIEKFQRAYENLRKIVDRLQEENRKIRNDFDEYKKRHPSTVGVKNSKPYAITKESVPPDDSIPKKKPGAQKGHKGHFRKIPQITEHVSVSASDFTCPSCSTSLVRKGIRTRVVEDVPPIMPEVIQYRIERMYCRKCMKIYESDVPNTLPGARLSMRAMLIVAYLKTGMRMSVENVSEAMKEMFGIRISEGEIMNILYQLSNALGPEYENILERVRNAPSRNIDTTSWRENGANMDMWTFVTKCEAIFHVSKSNNHEVALELLGKHRGTDTHDRHSSFETLAKKTKNPQQYCWSHIMCDAKELEEFYGEEGKVIKESLQVVYREAKEFHGKGQMDDVEKLYHKIVFLIDRDYVHPKCRKFVDNLLKRRKEWLFRFVIDPDVEPTNNRAERALRHSVINRKVSGGTRSSRGTEAYVKLHSIFYTTKLQGKSFIRDVPGMIKKEEKHPG